MRRRLAAIFSFLSLLLCAAACTFWVRSYRRADYFLLRPSHERGLSAISDNGAVQWMTVSYLRPSLFGEERRSGFEFITFPLSATQFDASGDDSNDMLTHEVVTRSHLVILRRFAAGRASGMYTGLRTGPVLPDFRYAYLVTPYWSLALVSAVVPVVRLSRRRHRSPVGQDTVPEERSGTQSQISTTAHQ